MAGGSGSDPRPAADAGLGSPAQAEIDELTACLRDLDQDIEHLKITRKPRSLTRHPRRNRLPCFPAYQQILITLADTGQSMRVRDLCMALDRPLVRKNAENTRAKLKRLNSLGIPTETEPGLFAQPCRSPGQPASTSPPRTGQTIKETSTREPPFEAVRY
ncbi:hypothetical protein AB0I81_54025 [Nonomuraea sp. NPDC050404]|uniref:hypothetical protein n=1 Tax=Nonomuraea sp. NPDC050404 TaxID=3155783 RepID=UPI0033D892C6